MSAVDQFHIWSFRGDYDFLSNFYSYDGRITAEHLFQSMKAVNFEDQLYVLAAPKPRDAKVRGNIIKKRPDWDEIRIDVMWCVLQIKFAHPQMKRALLATEDADLIEGNTWKDDFWGMVPSMDTTGENGGKSLTGANHLGKLLMELRQQLREEEK